MTPSASRPETFQLTVEEGSTGQRLDAWLAAVVPGLSRSRAKDLILAGEVRVAGAKIVEPKKPVNAGDAVTVTVPPAVPAEPAGEAIALNVVYEDAALIVIDKPAGLVVHPAAGNWTGTLVNALIAHCGDSLSGIGGVRRPGIVHRLDKETSGLMVVAKTDAAHQALAAQFADHGREGALTRAYLALVWGVPQPRRGTIDKPIGRSPKNRQRQAIVASGRRAVTHYDVIEAFGPGAAPVAALVRCRLETGRTHQIRVHMAAIGHPVIGDPAYGTGYATKAAKLPEAAQAAIRALGRQALHACELGFAHPTTGEVMVFEGDLPADVAAVADALRRRNPAGTPPRR